MKRQRRTVKSILEINLHDGYFVYGQILEAGVAFYDFRSKDQLTDFKALNNSSVLFVVEVYRDVISKGRWLKVGKLDIRKELDPPPNKFIHDDMNPGKFELYNPISGKITPAKKKDVEGLECSAVWEGEHVEERIRDYYSEIENKWVKQQNEVFM